jgi:uncharacterized membrane protein YhiD involved in acid resistance
MGILDLFGFSFDIGIEDTLNLTQIIFIILAVFALSLIIVLMYRFAYQTTVYSRSLAISLPIIAMIIAIIIISVSSNIVLALGMVGALSIVRFRTAIKNPFDTVFIFWAVALGVTAGAGLMWVAIVSTGIIAFAIFLLIVLELLVDSYILIIRAEDSQLEEEILKQVKELYGRFTLRNKTLKAGQLDLTIEVRSKQSQTITLNQLMDVPGVTNVILLSHKGDYISE